MLLHAAGGTRTHALAALMVFVLGAAFSFRDPFSTVLLARVPAEDRLIDHRESAAATISAFETPRNKRDLYINGLYVSSTDFSGRFMLHMPLLFHPDPKRTLIIGMGVGEAFKASIDHGAEPTVVDLVPEVIELFRIFQPEHADYLERGRVVINDGRNHLLATDERYDLVLVDGTPPIFASGMVNLYTLDFARLVRSRLGEHGIFATWVPVNLFESDFWMIARSYTETFEHVRVWALPGVTGMILIGSRSPIFETSMETLAARKASRLRVDEPLLQISVVADGLWLPETDLRTRASEVPLLTDDHPWTEFPLLRFARGEPFHTTSAFLARAKTMR